MRILVTGATGLIGAACLARLHRGGHDLTATARATGEAQRRAPFARWIAADFNRLTRSQDWLPLLAGIDAVVNCVGVLQSDARDDLARVQVDATVALFAACERAGVRRVIHVSAIGSDAAGPSDFARLKAKADADLQSRELDWIVLRPALVLAPNVYGGSAMLRALAAMPWLTPLVAGDARVQVVAAGDVAETVARGVEAGAPARVTWDLAHPQVLRLAEIVGGLRQWLGFAPQPMLRLPQPLAGAVALLADGLGRLGWRSPARSTALAQLAAGVVGDPAPWMAATGMAPASFADILARRPAGVQDRWFARLYLLKPVAVATLALFWIGTGLVALGPGRASAGAELAATGFPAAAVGATVVWGAWFDIVMGLALLWRRISRAVLILMLIVTPLYLLTGTLLAPRLWIDPLGPLLKILPMLLATAFTLAILDER
jgi:uncharacterized protein YbjT (DUF2867 family)